MGNLYRTIADLCAEKGVSGGRMCSDTGISKGLLTDLKMERRTGVSAVTAQKIASYFGVSVGYLLGQEEQKENSPSESTLTERESVMLKLFRRFSDVQQDEIILMLSGFDALPEDKRESALETLQALLRTIGKL